MVVLVAVFLLGLGFALLTLRRRYARRAFVEFLRSSSP
jgi:hypothetical protein